MQNPLDSIDKVIFGEIYIIVCMPINMKSAPVSAAIFLNSLQEDCDRRDDMLFINILTVSGTLIGPSIKLKCAP